MRLVVVALVLIAAPAASRTIQGVLGDAQERVGLRPAAPFLNFAQHFADLVTAPSLTSASSAALGGGTAIDSSESTLGPIFLDHADTLGAGVTNMSSVAQRGFAQGNLFAQPFNQLGLNVPPVVTKRTATAPPGSSALLAIRLRYAIDLHVWAAAIAVTHGFTDDFDASLVLPIVSTRLNCAATARLVAATGPNGGTFIPVHGGPTLGGTIEPVDSTGIGDLVVRGKYKLAMPSPWHMAATLEVQFPTGDDLQLHGSGDYWLTPGIDVSLPLFDKKAELDAHAALDFDVSTWTRSQALYGVSASVVLWPKRLAAIVEFLGQSQFESAFRPRDTNVLVLSPQGIAVDPLLGVGWAGRLDQFNFSFGLRTPLARNVMLFANGLVDLNPHVGVRPVGVIPTFGIGGTF